MSDEWQVFFAAQIGASAALLGLIFVGVSLNLERIVAAPALVRRALLALLLLLGVLLLGSLALIPGQPAALFAVELLVAGLALNGLGILVSRTAWRAPMTTRANIALNFVLSELATLPYLAAGLVLLAGGTGALGWIAAGMMLSTIKAVSDAWVLLVEINR